MTTQLTFDNLFSAVYSTTATAVKKKDFTRSDPWVVLMPRFATLCSASFEASHASCLDDFRRIGAQKITTAGSYGVFLLSSCGLSVSSTDTATNTQSERLAALELLYHTYYHSTKGKESVWIVSIPTNYTAWPHTHFNNATVSNILTALNAGSAEKFSFEDRKHIATAAQTGLAWTLKALVVLDDLSSGGNAMTLLKRWFGNSTTTEIQLTNFAANLRAGLLKVANKLNGGTAVVTDFVPIRGSTEVADQKARSANAFVVAAEAQNVIYIEEGFFSVGAKNVFQTRSHHWARIMVHEMTHREAATEDKRYGWAGIGPSTGKISPADAMVNADSWAIFVADAAGAMTVGDISRATNGT